MAKVDLKIKATDTSGNALTNTISYVNPDLTNAQLSTLAHNLNGLTTNRYEEGQKVTTVNIDSEADKQTPTLKLTLENGTDVSTITTNTTYIIVNSGDGDSYINCSPANASSDIFWGYSQVQGQPVKRTILFSSNNFTTLKIMSSETDTYKAASIQYNFA